MRRELLRTSRLMPPYRAVRLRRAIILYHLRECCVATISFRFFLVAICYMLYGSAFCSGIYITALHCRAVRCIYAGTFSFHALIVSLWTRVYFTSTTTLLLSIHVFQNGNTNAHALF